MSSSRSCVSYPSAVRRNGSWRFRYHPRKSRIAPYQKSQTAYPSPGRCSIRQPCPVQRSSPAHGWRPPAIGQSPAGNVNGVPSATYVASSSGSSRTTTTGNEAQQRPSFSTSRRVTTSPSDHMPVPRQPERAPARGRTPTFPARRPRGGLQHSLALGADLRRLRVAPDPELDALGELVLVLPAPRAVGAHDDVERLVRRVDEALGHDHGRLQVHVPAPVLPVRLPVDLDAVARARALEAEHVRLLPLRVEGRRVGHP